MIVVMRRIVDDQLFAHFITFSCDGRRRLLSLDHPKKIVLGVLHQELQRIDARCVGFVLMPNHVHAVVWFPQPGCLSRFMHEWKRVSGRNVRQWYAAQNLRYFENVPDRGRFWLPKYYAFAIDERAKLEEKLEYMHLNPVRAGLVQRAVDWPWSSARWYLLGQPVGVPIQWVE